MAELLVYNMDHWYDTTTQKRRDELDVQFPSRYDSRYVKGDIVEVRTDGFFGPDAHAGGKFVIVKILGVMDVDYLTQPLVLEGIPIKRRKYNVDLTQLSLSEFNVSVATLEDAYITIKVE